VLSLHAAPVWKNVDFFASSHSIVRALMTCSGRMSGAGRNNVKHAGSAVTIGCFLHSNGGDALGATPAIDGTRAAPDQR
jgi:hypothetical protein